MDFTVDSEILSYTALVFSFICAVTGRLVTKVFSWIHCSAEKLGVRVMFNHWNQWLFVTAC